MAVIPVRRNERNGWTVATVHYSMDTTKDDEWVEAYRSNMSEQAWQREMEIDWDAAGGTLVYPYFQQHRNKIVVEPFEIRDDMGGWFTAGFDHGKVNPTVFLLFWVNPFGTPYLIGEYYNPGHYKDHAEAIKAYEEGRKPEFKGK